MIECIFTLDYEIYGNGEGSLRELVLEPTRQLADIFHEFGAPFVVFAEGLEFAKMEEFQSDPDTTSVRAQLRELRTAGHEIALHIHPWWAKARYIDKKWCLNAREANICTLEAHRVEKIVSDAIQYLRDGLDDPHFTPVSFRSGLWAMQPTSIVAHELAKQGLKVDSSVYRGGVVRRLGLDYRPALRNREFWRFREDVNTPDFGGVLWEIPIYTEMVPFWQMLGRKRLRLQGKLAGAGGFTPLQRRWGDFARFHYPRKFDFCRMTFQELRGTIETILREQSLREGERTVVVAIGHSKDFVDPTSIRRFLRFVQEQSVHVTTLSRLFDQELQFLA